MEAAQAPQFMNLLPMVLVFVIFYFVVIGPQKKQQKTHQAMLDAIEKNDKVITAGGIHGVVVNVSDKTFTIRVDDNVKIKIDKSAVNTKVA